jgi:hypothetical protein
MKAIFCLVALLAAAEIRADVLGDSVEISPLKSWIQTDPQRPGAPPSPYPTLRYVPRDGRNATVLLTVVPAEVAKVGDGESLKNFFRLLARPYLSAPTAKLFAKELTLPQGIALYATFEDPDRVGKPIQPGSYKVTTPVGVLISNGAVLHVCIFTDSTEGRDLNEALQIVQSAQPRGYKSPVAEVAKAGSKQIVRVPALGSVLLLPGRFKPAQKGNTNPGYFSFVDEQHVNLSGWLAHSAEFKNMKEFWAKEKNTMITKAGIVITDESSKIISGWSAVLYTVQMPEMAPQRNIRACRVVGDTWADVHLSLVEPSENWKVLEDVLNTLTLAPK